MSEDRLASVRVWLRSWIECGSLPAASIGIFDADGSELFYHQESDSELTAGGKAVNRDSLFRMYSMTKPVTAVAALILIERGVLALDQPLEQWIPSFRGIKVAVGGTAEEPVLEDPATPLTLLHLFTHTSGISYGFFGNNANDLALRRLTGDHYKSWFSKLSSEELCDAIAQCPLCFHPGTQFHYSLSTDVLGRVVEVASGMTLDRFFEEEIFRPLGMLDTSFVVPAQKGHRLMDCFEVVPGKHFKPSVGEERDRLQPRRLLSGGGGLVSTMGDFSRFSSMLANGGALGATRILSEETIALMRRNHLAGDADVSEMSYEHGFSEQLGPGAGFGLGVSVVTKPDLLRGGTLSPRGEFGWGGVAATFFFVDPVHKLSCIFLTQVIPAAAEYPIRAQQRWLAHWALGHDSQPAT